MELSVQLGIVAFATVLFLVLVRQLPTVPSVRWWFYAGTTGCAALLMAWLAPARPGSIAAGMLLIAGACGCAQICFVGRGLLRLDEGRPQLTYVSVALGLLLVVAASARIALTLHAPVDAYLKAQFSAIVPATLCGIFAVHLYRQNSGREKRAAALAALFLGTWGLQVLSAFGWRFEAAVPPWTLLRPGALGIMAQCAAALVMAHAALNAAHAGDAEFRRGAKRLRQLVDGTGYGICEVAANGQLTYANPAAAAMFGAGEQTGTGVSVGEILDAKDHGTSAQTMSEFLLRPTSVVSQAKASIRRPDGSAISVEWSSSPIVRDQQPAGAVMTLRDITQTEVAERFAGLRSDLLEMIARNVSVEEVSRVLATGMEQQLPGFCCSVLACEGDNFRMLAAPSLPDPFRPVMSQLPASRFFPRGEQRPWEQVLREVAPTFGFRDSWTEPMISTANEVLGIVVLNHCGTPSFSPLQQSMLTEAARLGGLAVERHRSFERLLHQGHYDALTGLPNRFLFADRLKQAMARAERARGQLAILCIDLDRFKYVNDTLGHDLGDRFLQQISVRFAARIRASDTLARTGGDEFTAIISDLHRLEHAGNIADSLIVSIRDPFDIEGHTLYGAASIGIAVYPQDGSDPDTLLRNADRAMYRAKAQGSNTIQYYSSADVVDVSERMDIEFHLHRALEQGNFSLNFQPQFTCDHRLAGFEALLRFRHPKLGPVPPSRFIPLAEESGLILPIGEWVLHEVCRQIADWQKEGMRPVRVAVNVSPLQFSRPDFAETVARALRQGGVKPELLELELTEGVLMKTGDASATQVDKIAKMGVRLAVDDFGTGYSSLSYLHQLPIHVLKIDRSFIEKMLEPAGTRSIVEAIISLAHRLGLQTVAEGVETADQLALLQDGGCDLIQGFLFSKPLSAVDASRLLWRDNMVVRGPDAGRGWNSAAGKGPRLFV